MKIELYNSDVFTCYLLGSTKLLITCVEYLLSHNWKIKGIVTTDTEVIKWANQSGIDTYVDSKELENNYSIVDYIFSIINHEILSSSLLSKTRVLNINYHDSLLPKYAGLNSTSWAIYNGEKTHGVSWHIIDTNIDTGTVLIQEELKIDANAETATSLNLKCTKAAIDTFKKLIHEIELSTLTSKSQDLSQRSYYSAGDSLPNLGVIDWNYTASYIDRFFRSLNFGAYDNLFITARVLIKAVPYVINEVLITKDRSLFKPGRISKVEEGHVFISTIDCDVIIKTVFDLEGNLVEFNDLINKHNLNLNDQLSDYLVLSKHLIKKFNLSKINERDNLNKFINYRPPIFPKNKIYENYKYYSETVNFDNYSIKNSDIISAILIFLYRALLQESVSIDCFVCNLSDDQERIFFIDYVPVTISFFKNRVVCDVVNDVYVQTEGTEIKILNDIFIRYKNKISNFSHKIAFTHGSEEKLFNKYLIIFQWRFEERKLDIYFRNDLIDISNSLTNGIRNIFNYIKNNNNSIVDSIPIVNESEREKLLENFSSLKKVSRNNETILSLFVKQTLLSSDIKAVIVNNDSITYQELNEQSDKFAYILKQYGVEKLCPVPIYLERNIHFIVAILGVLKLGAAYVPIDSENPIERVREIINDINAKIIVSESGLKNKIKGLNTQFIIIDDLSKKIEKQEILINSKIEPNDLAYIIYTSGSSGKPKGVCCKHNSVINLLDSIQSIKSVHHAMSGTLWTSIGFDVSVYEIWSCLLYGLTLHILPNTLRKNIKEVLKYIYHHAINSVYLPEFILEELSQFSRNHKLYLTRLLVGVEPIKNEVLYKIKKTIHNITVINGYGPTETTICATLYEVNTNKYQITPIGKPIENSYVYLLDQNMNPVPMGFYGELYIGGIGLARGYWSNDKENKDRFIVNPFDKTNNSLLFKTDDIVRCLENGNIEYIGRKDFQLKIRGYRIEPNEISLRLSDCPGIKSSYVCTINNLLIAYYISDKKIIDNQLKEYLHRYFPDYMVPDYFVQVGKFPMTLDGKINRVALPNPIDNYQHKKIISPRNDVELKLVEIWKDVLNIENISIEDEFFSIGGDSIKLIKIIYAAQDNKISFSISDILKYKNIKKLSEVVKIEDHTEELPRTPFSLLKSCDYSKLVLLTDIEDAYPLSKTQLGMIYSAEKDQSSNIYKTIFGIELKGNIDCKAFKTNLSTIIDNSPALRKKFDLYQFSEPLQLVSKKIKLPFNYFDYSEKSEKECINFHSYWWDEQLHYKFKLDELPLVRFYLYKISRDRYFFGIVYHHTVLDGWSLSVLVSDLLSFSNVDFPRENPKKIFPKVEMPQYVLAERIAENNDKYKTFWEKHIKNFVYEKAPFIKHNKQNIGTQLVAKSFVINKKLLGDLNRISNSLTVPLRVLFLSIHLKVISMFMSRKDIITGMTVNGRLPLENFDRALGLFVSAVPIRVDFSTCLTWKQIIEYVHNTDITINEYSRYPLSKIIENSKHEKLFDVLFNYIDFYLLQNINNTNNIEVIKINVYDHTNYALLINCEKCFDSVNINFLYDSSVIENDEVVRLILYYQQAIENLLLNIEKDEKIDSQSLIPKVEFDKIVKTFNSTRKLTIGNKSIVDLFLEQVIKNPDTIAVKFEENMLTYSQLDIKSNELAMKFIIHGASASSIISACMLRNCNLIITVLAILRIGACYLPIEVKLPFKRKQYILEDSKSNLLVVDSYSSEELSALKNVKIINIDEIVYNNNILKFLHNAEINLSSPAYIIYTSGTTGFPKGIIQNHRTITNLIQAISNENCNQANIMQYCSIAFDVHLQEVFYALLNGYTLNIVNDIHKENIFNLINYINGNLINEIFLPTKVFELFVESYEKNNTNSLRKISIAGEKLNITKAVKNFINNIPEITVINQYGPSETHVVTESVVSKDNIYLNSIGKPIANTKIFILDKQHNVVPIGVRGEIYISGYGVIPGYINHSNTSEQFIVNPYFVVLEETEEIYMRLYKTGDMARWRHDGTVEFIGREDFQVKIRGNRIELSEIEEVLSQYPDVTQSVVTVCDKNDSDKHLLAYYSSPHKINDQMLNRYLSDSLPNYMVPMFFIHLEKMPLNTNGKIDRSALPNPKIQVSNTEDCIIPHTEIEQILTDIWCQILTLEKINSNENFFALGTHSLKIMQAVIKIKQILNANISIDSIFKYQTIHDLGNYIQSLLLQKNISNVLTPSTNIDSEAAPISFTQERLWLIDKNMANNSRHYNISITYHLTGPLNLNSLEKAFHLLIDRHESLRTYFHENQDGTVDQKIEKYDQSNPYPFEIIYFSTSEECISAIRSVVSHVFDLKKPKLFYVKLYCISGVNEYFLFLNHHHIITDGWSVQILLQEVSYLYNHLLQNDINPSEHLQYLSIKYIDYARWQKKFLREESRYNQLIEYWRKQLQGIKPLLLPTKNPRPEVLSNNGDQYCFQFSKKLMDKLKNFSYQNNCTLFMTLLSCFAIMLKQYSNQDDIVIGTAVANRTDMHLDNLIGFFANILGLRLNLKFQNFLELLNQVKKTCIAAYIYQDLPFKVLLDDLAIERYKSYTPIFQVMLIVEDNLSGRTLTLNSIEAERIYIHNGTSKLDLMLGLYESDNGYNGIFEYNTDLYDLETVQQMVFHYEKILDCIVEFDDPSLDKFEMLYSYV